MKYLCMIFYDEKKHTAMSEPEHEALTNEALTMTMSCARAATT